MGPMLFSWQNKRTGDPVKMFKHKKRHEAQYATPADAEVMMKRRGYSCQRTLYRIYSTCNEVECQGKLRKKAHFR